MGLFNKKKEMTAAERCNALCKKRDELQRQADILQVRIDDLNFSILELRFGEVWEEDHGCECTWQEAAVAMKVVFGLPYTVIHGFIECQYPEENLTYNQVRGYVSRWIKKHPDNT